MNKWNGLVRALIEHWKQRYGTEEINQWYYEVWNEPDLRYFWSGTRDQYLELYRNTAVTVKSVCPNCRVGGPASSNDSLEQPWLTFIAKEHIPADFESTHTYAVTQGAVDTDGSAGTVLDVSPDSIVKRVRGSRSAIDASATPKLELHYTEWSTAYTPTDPIHDQYISAPFILQKLHDTASYAQSMSYWTFTDIFEENGPRATPFHGGFGLMNYQDIRKPSYFAYKFLAALGDTDLATGDPQSWITRGRDKSVQALFWNYTPIAGPGTGRNQESDQVFYKREQPAQPAPATELKIAGIPNGTYALNVYRTGYKQNDAYTAYLALGSPNQLTREQVASLQKSASGAPTETRIVTVRNHVYEEHFEMHQNDTVLVTLKPR
jgi:xylan 1,4-beta-xylosidase